MIKRLLNKYWYSVPELIQIEYMRLSTVVFISALTAPLILKTQGVEFSLAIIGILSLLMRFKSIVVVVLKDVTMKTRGLLYIISSMLGIIGSFTYFTDIYVWIIIQVIYTLINNILLEMYYTEYDIIVSNEYSSAIFKEMKYTEKIVITFSGALGAGIAVALSSHPSIIIIMVITCATLLGLPLGIKQYRKL